MEVRLVNLSKHFPGRKGAPVVKAVDNMTLTIPDGTFVGLLGPSGCGKSTTLYLIAGLHEPTEGAIWFGDKEVTDVPPENRGIGLVFQNYALYPHFTVRQNITFPLENVRPRLSKQEMENIAQECANIVDISQLLDRKPKELSGGQQQRVAIARALAKRPQVLLLDEPLSNLDARLRLQTREELKRIQRLSNVTTVFVTHDQEEAMSISDQIVVMKKGVIHQVDEPQTVYEEPVDLFVAKFLGSPAINIFKGELVNGALMLGGKKYLDGFKSKGEFDLLDERIFDIVKPNGYRATKRHYYADLGVNLGEGETEQVVEEPKKKFSLFGAKKEEPVILAEKPEKLTIEVIYDAVIRRGCYLEEEEFNELVGKFLVEAKTNRPIYIGVRPESFSLDKTDNPPVDVEVDYVEHIGRDISIVGHVSGEGSRLRAIIPAELRTRVKGSKIKLYPKRVYLFELSGERIK
ncbi:MAG: ABC transporter ATP-binding protein [Erysipelotrichaceae bacterium]|jgi:multiple sugar transport system ATP-binding protein|nr:ABC transporter ATP-binding protein [Erysipelotrichaceae bacterium]